jgi:hypothetical protein
VPQSLGKAKKKLNTELSQLSGFTGLPFVNNMLNGDDESQQEVDDEDEGGDENDEAEPEKENERVRIFLEFYLFKTKFLTQ